MNTDLQNRMKRLRAKIDQAAKLANRNSDEIEILAISKGQDAKSIKDLFELGQIRFGENYLQEALTKQEQLKDFDIEWHFVGSIQSNKTKEIAILKTLGLSNKSIKKTFFLTGLTISFFATLSGVILGIIFSLNIEKLRIFLSTVFNLEIFPSDIYFLDKLPSEININSILIIFFISIIISAIASYLPAMKISKMKTFRALRYE